MYAVIRDGSAQMRVDKGDTVQLAYRADAEPGSTLSLDQVLLLGDGDDVAVGTPLVEGASVTAKVTRHGKGRKITVYHFKRRKNVHKKQGHRQPFTEVTVESIEAPSA